MEKNIQEEQSQQDDITLKLRELIWDNKIPVKITIDNEDIANDQEEPFPLFIFIHRIHYPAMIYSEIHKFFERYCPIPLGEPDIWLEWNSKPIPWNIPFGVFFDLNYDDHSNQLPSFQPINIILHYRNYPSELLSLEKNVEDQVKRDYKFSLKEASIIRYGQKEGCKNIIQDQNVTEWDDMWKGYRQCDMLSFYQRWDDKIWKPKSNERAQLPLRIYIKGYLGRIQEAAEIKDATYTLGQYLCDTFPKIFSKNQEFYSISEDFSEVKILSHGIDCDLNMPLLYFLRKFYYPDGFSYIVIIL